ncbi:zinc-dependent alcohol dehydrogenase [Thermogemmatispora sp.]|uniref:zinc-dependent alcohol dehydrogenase n=1 Tax=Thermogemmatispora sp. TaxID=1968838 RepID=UPI001E080C26|nr:zinc-binding dehydrogenase [Thermogemmatispora sp.]MBX5448963.1 alcohol dehydrogenase catalytic domain-containing protein [Thermogemmatispora sp.]
MKAILFYRPGEARLEEIPTPQPGRGELLVKIGTALTCGTDLKTYRRGHPTMLKNKQLPVPFGHEFAGTVVAVGADVETFSPGQRVVAVNSAPCGSCYYCLIHRESLCENLEFLNGAYAEYIVIPERIVRKNTYLIPDELSFGEAALLEPLACAVHGVEEINVQLGDTVVVNGAGPIGLMFVNIATLRGARVISCDLSEERLAAARYFGAVATINAAQVADQVAAVRALTPGGRGADIAIEAVGQPAVWEKTIAMVRKGGQALLFGGASEGTSITVDTVQLHYSELTIKGVFHHTPRHVRLAFDLICSGQVRARDYISANKPLTETIEALELIGQQHGIKYAIVPPEGTPAPLGALALSSS